MCEISVVVSIFNTSKYLEKNIKSILRQSFKDFELLLIDDGSTDESGAICDKLALTDVRIKVFHNENSGVSAARNFGIRHSSGKYICFIDSDDYIHKKYLEKLYCLLSNSNSDMAVCNFCRINADGRRMVGLNSNASASCIYEILKNDLLLVVWNKLFVKEKIKHLFDEAITFSEDTLFCINYFIDNKAKIEWTDDVLYSYLCHDKGLTKSFQISAWEGLKGTFLLELCLTKKIENLEQKRLAIRHICSHYFFGVYTFVFENLARAKNDKNALDIIEHIINDKQYRKVVRFIFHSSISNMVMNRNDYGLSKKEIAYIVGSMLNNSKLILGVAKLKVFYE